MTAGTIDVVVLTWNDGSLLQVALSSALAQDGLTASVTVVDNGSTPPASVLDDPRVLLIRNEENRGVGGGRNQGTAAGRALFVCFLDSDAELHAGALQTLVAPMLEDDTIALTAPVFTDQCPEASAGRAPTFLRKVRRALNLSEVYGRTVGQGSGAYWDVDFAIGACQVFRRSVFEQLGGLDASDSFGPEDVDFCLRIKSAGHRVVQVSGATCTHPPRRAFKGLLTERGVRHSVAVLRHLWRHRGRRVEYSS